MREESDQNEINYNNEHIIEDHQSSFKNESLFQGSPTGQHHDMINQSMMEESYQQTRRQDQQNMTTSFNNMMNEEGQTMLVVEHDEEDRDEDARHDHQNSRLDDTTTLIKDMQAYSDSAEEVG